MKGIGTLEINRYAAIGRNLSSILNIEKAIVEINHSWLNCIKSDNKLLCKGFIQPIGCCRKYEILVEYSPIDYCLGKRIEKIWVVNPNIKWNSEIHMYKNDTLCLYYPPDLSLAIPLSLNTLLPWVAEWLVKYEFWERYKVWIGVEVQH